MSVWELSRVAVLARVKAGTLTVKAAAVLLGTVSHAPEARRQRRRLWPDRRDLRRTPG
jgi:hypothetical protein